MAAARKPWDQLPDEPGSASVRFLIYRNLGPGRSLCSAYNAFLGKGQKGSGKRLPGQWYGDCSTFDWVRRARVWDVELLMTHGQETVLVFLACLEHSVKKTLAALKRLKGPEDWKAVTQSLIVLSSLIPPETVEAVCVQAGDGSVEDDGDEQCTAAARQEPSVCA